MGEGKERSARGDPREAFCLSRGRPFPNRAGRSEACPLGADGTVERIGERDDGLHGAGARPGRRRPGPDQPEPGGRRGPRSRRPDRRRGLHPAARRPARRDRRAPPGRRARPRRHALLDARALLPLRPNAALHAAPSSPLGSPRSTSASSTRTRWSRAAAAPSCHAAGLKVVVGERAAEAAELIEDFAAYVTQRRPFVVAKWAMTLDGKIATRTGESRWITGTAARQAVHQTPRRRLGRDGRVEHGPRRRSRADGPARRRGRPSRPEHARSRGGSSSTALAGRRSARGSSPPALAERTIVATTARVAARVARRASRRAARG